MKNKFKLFYLITVIIFSVISSSCHLTSRPTAQEMRSSTDKYSGNRDELIAEFKRNFEGVCTYRYWAYRWHCSNKIEKVTSKGFFYFDIEVLGGERGEKKHRGFWSFLTKPNFEYAIGLIHIRKTNDEYAPWLTVNNKEMALRIYGLLENIYQTYQ